LSLFFTQPQPIMKRIQIHLFVVLGLSLLFGLPGYSQFSTVGNYTTTTDSVGIGTSSPAQKLSILNGHISLSPQYGIGNNIGTDNENILYLNRSNTNTLSGSNGYPWSGSLSIESDGGITFVETDEDVIRGWMDVNNNNFYWSGKVGIKTTDPDMDLTVAGHVNIGADANGMLKTRHVNGKSHTSTAYGNLYLNYHTNYPVIIGNNTNKSDLYVFGEIGIGTTTPTEKLEVNGTIRSKEVKVEAAPWPDYVFSSDYSLMSLQELQDYINTNGHLPEVPDADTVEEEGIALGEMNALLLKKIEELTLYQIELLKLLEEQNKRNESLEARIITLENN
jgi:hypothetical protein